MAPHYSPDDLCEDLGALLHLDPSVAQEKDSWMAQAQAIESKLRGFIDIDRSEFAGIPGFLHEGWFYTHQADYYAEKRRGVYACIAQYKASL